MYKKSYQKFLQVYLIALIVLGSFLGGLYFGRSKFVESKVSEQGGRNVNIENKDEGKPDNVDFSLFWEVWHLIETKSVQNHIDGEKMLYGAIKGLVASLDDPYSVFMDPDETKKFQEEIDGSFEGIGAEIGVRDRRLTIVTVLDNTPAKKSGLRAKDAILRINDLETSDMTLFEAVNHIKGEKGSTVQLTIYREGKDEPIIADIVRDKIVVESVESEIKEDKNGDKVLYVKIKTFSENTAEKFDLAVADGLKAGISGVVVDLRGNTGGLLDQAVDVSSEFLAKGDLIAIEEFSNGERKEFKSNRKPRLKDVPVAILVDGGSASASEILAGALKDGRGTKLVGEKTYGKGTVQELITIEGNSSLRISVAKWLTPNGTDINQEGIAPDVEIETNVDEIEAGNDAQLDKALEIISE
ncbi:S41 family peptidase [Patescibacteria group bacterium]|nr:S41 family peptidase [Patescibacteria group bacterium]